MRVCQGTRNLQLMSLPAPESLIGDSITSRLYTKQGTQCKTTDPN